MATAEFLLQRQPDIQNPTGGPVAAVVAPDGYGVLSIMWQVQADAGGTAEVEWHPVFYHGHHIPAQTRPQGPYPAKIVVNVNPDADWVSGKVLWWAIFVEAHDIETLPSPANFTSADTLAVTLASSPTLSFTVTTDGGGIEPPVPVPVLSATSADGSALPSGLTFTDGGSGSGTLAGTTPAVGTYSLTFNADNGVASSPGGWSQPVSQAFTLVVS